MDNQTLVQLGAGALTLIGSAVTGWIAYKTRKANLTYNERTRYQRKRSILDLKDREAVFKLQEEIREQSDKRIEELEERLDRMQIQLNDATAEKYTLLGRLTALQQAHDNNLTLIEKYAATIAILTDEVAELKRQLYHNDRGA